MKANGLSGEYCQNCASILDDVQRTHRRVIVLDGQCVAMFQQSGDAARLDERVIQSHPASRPVVEEPVKEVVNEGPKPEPKHKAPHKTEHKTASKKR